MTGREERERKEIRGGRRREEQEQEGGAAEHKGDVVLGYCITHGFLPTHDH